MDIKPPSLTGILPASGATLRDRVAEPFASPDPQLDQGQSVNPPQTPAVDPAAQRITSDPWGSTAVGDRLLMSQTGSAESLPDVSDISLPDAVRRAVDFVFETST